MKNAFALAALALAASNFETAVVRGIHGMPWGPNLGFSKTVRLLMPVEAFRQ